MPKLKTTLEAGRTAGKIQSPYRIAILDDDREVLEHLGNLLRLDGYDVDCFSSHGKFIDSLGQLVPHLLLLDIELPGMAGWQFLRMLKERPDTRALLVVLMSGKFRSSKNVTEGLKAGADDYLAYSVQPEFLAARIAALLRRAFWREGIAGPSHLTLGPLTIDSEAHVSLLDGQPLHLTPLEFNLLAFMVKNRNRVLTRGLILEKVWNSDSTITTRTIDKHIESLRRKLGALGTKIETVVNVGYKLND